MARDLALVVGVITPNVLQAKNDGESEDQIKFEAESKGKSWSRRKTSNSRCSSDDQSAF